MTYIVRVAGYREPVKCATVDEVLHAVRVLLSTDMALDLVIKTLKDGHEKTER